MEYLFINYLFSTECKTEFMPHQRNIYNLFCGSLIANKISNQIYYFQIWHFVWGTIGQSNEADGPHKCPDKQSLRTQHKETCWAWSPGLKTGWFWVI